MLLCNFFAFIGSLNLEKCDIVDCIEFMNQYVGLETTGKAFGVGLVDDASGNLSFNVGTIAMTEESIVMAFNLRYPVTFKLDDMMTPFNARIEGSGMRVENFVHQEPLYFPEDHVLIKSLQKVYEEQTGDTPKLLAIGGGTYAKEMPNIVAFGPTFPGKPDVIHKPNENIEIEDLILNAKIYAHAIYELAK